MGINDNTIQDFLTTIKQEPKKTINKSGAVVSRLDEEGTVWVFVAGSETETPTESTTAEVKTGDSVTVEWRNNKLYIVGNNSDPAVGTEKVQKVEAEASQATFKASEAMAMAEEAMKKIAGDSNQYFWHTESGTDTGSHITEITEEDFIANPRGGNLLARSNGIAIRDGLEELTRFGKDGIDLGINSISSKITMCDQIGQFSAFEEKEEYEVEGETIEATLTTLALVNKRLPQTDLDGSSINIGVEDADGYISPHLHLDRGAEGQAAQLEASTDLAVFSVGVDTNIGAHMATSESSFWLFDNGHAEYEVFDHSNNKAFIDVISTQSGIDVGFGIGSGGTNHGIYSRTNGKWITYADDSGNVFLNGVNYESQTANKVLASPNGSTGKPTFRALVQADIPNLNASKITAGTLDADILPSIPASKITGTLADARIPAGILRKAELVGQTFSKASLSVNANNYLANQTLDVTKSGYTAIGLLGVWCTGTNVSFAMPYQTYLDGNTVKFNIRNFGTTAASLTFYARVLYKES